MEHETVQAEGIVLDLSMLLGKNAAELADIIGNRGLIIPFDAYNDVLTREHNGAGARAVRFKTLHRRLAKLVTQYDVATVTVRVEGNPPTEKHVDGLHFLAHDTDQLFNAIEPKVEADVARKKANTRQLIERIKEIARRPEDGDADENMGRTKKLLTKWSNNGVVDASGELVDWITRAVETSAQPGELLLFARAAEIVFAVVFLQEYGRLNYKADLSDEQWLAFWYDWTYAIFAIRYNAEFITADSIQRKTYEIARAVAKKTPYRFRGVGQ